MAMNDFRSVFLPYCLERQANGSYLVLNRRYKPVGLSTREYIDYAAFPVSVTFKRLTASTLRKLSCDPEKENLDKVWLYKDDCIPTASAKNMRMYMEKLEILSKLQLV